MYVYEAKTQSTKIVFTKVNNQRSNLVSVMQFFGHGGLKCNLFEKKVVLSQNKQYHP